MSNAGFTLTTMDSAAAVAKKRATEKRKWGAHAQIPYTDGERAIARTAMQERAVGGKVPFASVADFLITEYSFSGDRGYLREKIRQWWDVDSGAANVRKKQCRQNKVAGDENNGPVMVEQPKEADPDTVLTSQAHVHVAEMTKLEVGWMDATEATFPVTPRPPAVKLSTFSNRENRTTQKESRQKAFSALETQPPTTTC